MAEGALEHADLVVKGEGEEVVRQVVAGHRRAILVLTFGGS